MKNYPQWDRMDDFLKQHRNPRRQQPPKWGRRGLAIAGVVVVVLVIMGLSDHRANTPSVQNGGLVKPSVPAQNTQSVQSTQLTAQTSNLPSNSNSNTVTIALPSPVTA